jgi:hypothetical protein
VFGVTSEVAPVEFPESLVGYYYVANWQPMTEKVYIQAVVIAWEPDNLEPADLGNYQLRYILGGITEEPFEIANGKFIFLDTQQFGGGRWIRFELPVRQDFQDLWGAVPTNFDSIRVLFEVRWDDANLLQEQPSQAEVFFDNLYFGPSETAPGAR